MLTEKQIKALVVLRIIACADSCGSNQISHIDGQIRALAAVLRDGVPPPAAFGGDTAKMLDYAGIPYYRNVDRTIGFPEEWLTEHGFIVDGDDFHYHDRNFGSW